MILKAVRILTELAEKVRLRKALVDEAIVIIEKYYKRTTNEGFGLMLEMVVAAIKKVVGEDRIQRQIEHEAGVCSVFVNSAVELLSE